MNQEILQYLERLSNGNAPTPMSNQSNTPQNPSPQSVGPSPQERMAPSYRNRKRKKEAPQIEIPSFGGIAVPSSPRRGSLERVGSLNRPRAKSVNVPFPTTSTTPNPPLSATDLASLLEQQRQEISRLQQMNQELQRENIMLKNASPNSTHQPSPLHSPHPATPQGTISSMSTLYSLPSSNSSIHTHASPPELEALQTATMQLLNSGDHLDKE